MIFVDTSAIYALADRSDPNHGPAVNGLRVAIAAQEELLIHSGILVEAAALLQHRLGLAAAVTFLDACDQFNVHWVTVRDHEAAVALLKQRGRRGLGLVDCTSFAVMRLHRVTRALVFDSDFADEGFEIVPQPT